MTLNCTQYKHGTKFPSQAIQESQAFKEQREKSQKKGENQLFFSGLNNKRWSLPVLTTEE